MQRVSMKRVAAIALGFLLLAGCAHKSPFDSAQGDTNSARGDANSARGDKAGVT